MFPAAHLLTIRPVDPGDSAALAAAFDRLSPESRRRRFLGAKSHLTKRELTYLTDVDHVTHEALVARSPAGDVVAVARYAPWPTRPGVADLAVTVVDDWHGRGLGTSLGRRAVDAARRNGVALLTASTLLENEPARKLLTRLGFRPAGGSSGVLDFELELAPALAAAA